MKNSTPAIILSGICHVVVLIMVIAIGAPMLPVAIFLGLMYGLFILYIESVK